MTELQQCVDEAAALAEKAAIMVEEAAAVVESIVLNANVDASADTVPDELDGETRVVDNTIDSDDFPEMVDVLIEPVDLSRFPKAEEECLSGNCQWAEARSPWSPVAKP